MLSALRWLEDRVVAVERFLGSTCMLGVVAICAMQVFARYVIGYPLPWSQELATYLFIWTTFFGAAIAVYSSDHLAIQYFQDLLPVAVARIVAIFCFLIAVVTCAIIGYISLQNSLNAMDRSASLGYSMSWFYGAIPAGCFLMTYHFTMRLIDMVAGEPPPGRGQILDGETP
ncbi:TRAP-type C4-dicarboxylate transport system permease small subunit [Natronocella acetinitrilica]|uniref:TRAP transporter small permease protein n=1 Tax=Natronocella acetinitrilica TaxID=414046 RepID=A0AAE3KBR0_9GAMM|nr:TRAP-type C4-dicarboxylate transport system permease small subunit [Natronocella acetinitrilica]